MNLKTNLLCNFLLLLGCLLLVGCQVEDLKESASEQNAHSPIVKKKFSEFNNLPGLLSEIFPNQTLAARGSGSNPLYQFEIDSTSVTQIINNGIAYYTMAVTRENMEEDVFENLVVFDDGSEKKAVLVKYKPDASYLTRHELNPDAQFTGKFNMTELGYSNLGFRLSTTTTKCFVNTHLYCTNNNPPTLAGPGCYKNEDGGAHVKSVTAVNCFEVVVNTPQPYLNSTFILDPNNSDAGGGNLDIGTAVATNPVFMGIIDFRFIRRLTPAQKAWWNNANNNAAVAAILNYLKGHTTNHSYINGELILDGDVNSEAKAFVKNFIQNCIDSRLNLNFEKSLDSPANIDFSGIDLNTPEGKKLDCIYKTMMTVPAFKDLFQNTFGTNERLNVKFEIADNLPANLNGNCQMFPSSVNGVAIYNNLIRINKNILDNSKSDIFIARVILHEAIHAYLNIKQVNCNNGATLTYLNNLQLGELIGTFYQGFNCHITVNGSVQSQHDFVFSHMIPTFMDVLWGLKDKLISQAHQQQITSDPFYTTTTGAPQPFVWNDFFYNISLAGLHQTESFTNHIASDPEKLEKFNFYNRSAQLLTKNCN